MKWNVRFFLKNFRKKTKSTNRERIAIIVRKRNKETSRRRRQSTQKSRKENDIRKSQKKDDIRNNRKENDIKWFWNRKSHESESRISFFAFDKETKRHKHRNTETINNNRHSINKIISFDKWYRWDHRRIEQSRTTKFNTSQRNFHEIVEISRNLICYERYSFSRQRKQRQQRF